MTAEDIFQEIKNIREHIHENPELSFQEYKTQAYIASFLDKWNIDYKKIGDTGLVGLVKCNIENAPCIALRADIDALPIIETTNASYASQNEGVMHACGHDVHSAILLGTIKLLQSRKEELKVNVKFIFQPGEEKLPGGASILIKEGVLENPKVDKIIALHVFPELEVGKLGIKDGMYMASCDEIYIKVTGKGGHGAMPHLNVDPVLISSHLIVSLQQLVSRISDPSIPNVLSFGKIVGNGATNVIPDEVNIEGTFRTMNEAWRKKAHSFIQKHATELCESMGGSCQIEIRKGYPYLENDVKLTAEVKTSLEQKFGNNNVIDLPIRMTGEDFGFYAQKVPACFFRLGVRNESKNIKYGVHNSNFDIDDEALKVGMDALLQIVLDQNERKDS